VLSFADLYDQWKNLETGERIASCTIIVKDASAGFAPGVFTVPTDPPLTPAAPGAKTMPPWNGS
jgi:hypothetical protein